MTRLRRVDSVTARALHIPTAVLRTRIEDGTLPGQVIDGVWWVDVGEARDALLAEYRATTRLRQRGHLVQGIGALVMDATNHPMSRDVSELATQIAEKVHP